MSKSYHTRLARKLTAWATRRITGAMADFVIGFFDLRPIAFPIRVGMYEYPSVTNVPVMDAAGNAYSDAVTAER